MATAYETGNAATDVEMSEMLEGLVDRWTLTDVLEQLARVCGEKAEHLRSNWQDNESARVWDRMYNRIRTAEDVARECSV